jgi:hypothetical protein
VDKVVATPSGLACGKFLGGLLYQYIIGPHLKWMMLHILQDGLGSWYHLHFHSILVNGASGHDGISQGQEIFGKVLFFMSPF